MARADNRGHAALTHISLIFERKLAVFASTMKMRGTLSEKRAVRRATLFGRPQSLEAFLNNGRIFSVVIRVHLHVRSADVHFIARSLYVKLRKLYNY